MISGEYEIKENSLDEISHTERTMMAIQELANKIPELTLRDLFAISALNGLASQQSIYNIKEEYTASFAYALADKMLARRNK